ncbi:MAG: hypothetical protein F4106_10640 [Gemmatimonadetes bacterium]|nr:hypothetical protein [Gemmatimonadota bacterium]MXX71417.1 hypothetical protein [Gemmatimonadota bacterium]MYC92076.1 hypothetical protein [Gemmatimonadota bacterium]MYG37216.1 hypothetical protein [Gemmatimonadota bacterium]MYJ18476.1 hypothetical protein [Gemmatimonadota bacterium]
MPTRLLSPLILSAGLLACGGDTGPTRGVQVQVSDSAGVRIVGYLGVPEIEPPFTLAEEPIYRHGANPGDYIFQFADAGRLFPDGSAVVADWSGAVVVLSADGTTHDVLARRGEGPGEVISAYSLFVLGQDSVLVPDDRLSRLTLFVGDSVARIVSLPRGHQFGVAGIGSSGELLLWNRYAYRSWVDIEEEWLAGHMTLFNTETGALDTVASYDHVHRERSGQPRPIIRPFGEVMAAGGRFVQTRTDRPEITWRLPDGTVTRIVRWRPGPNLLTEELLEHGEAYNRMIGKMNYGMSEARLEEVIQRDMARYRAMIGQPIPLFGTPFADADGNVWLPSYRPAYPAEGSPYTVISPDGEWLGQVETPRRFRILDVTGGLVLGVLRDEVDVQNVVVHEVVEG